MTPLVLYGAGSQAYVLHDFTAECGYDLTAVLNDVAPLENFDLGVPVVVGREHIESWLRGAEIGRAHV